MEIILLIEDSNYSLRIEWVSMSALRIIIGPTVVPLEFYTTNSQCLNLECQSLTCSSNLELVNFQMEIYYKFLPHKVYIF